MKEKIVLELSKKYGVSRQITKNIMDDFMLAIQEAIINGGKMELRGFGTFYSRFQIGKPCNLPGKHAPANPRFIIKFKAVKKWEVKLNEKALETD